MAAKEYTWTLVQSRSVHSEREQTRNPVVLRTPISESVQEKRCYSDKIGPPIRRYSDRFTRSKQVPTGNDDVPKVRGILTIPSSPVCRLWLLVVVLS